MSPEQEAAGGAGGVEQPAVAARVVVAAEVQALRFWRGASSTGFAAGAALKPHRHRALLLPC